MRLRRTAALVAALTMTLSGAVACGSDSGSQGNAAGVLNIGMPNGPQTQNHNPFLPSSSGASLGYRYVIYEPLVMTSQIKPDEEGKPWLATKWEWSDNYQ
jgi:peptide/nickel transport system substrate-binding protein